MTAPTLAPNGEALAGLNLDPDDIAVIVRALTARAGQFERVAARASTVTDLELAVRAVTRHRTLANRLGGGA